MKLAVLTLFPEMFEAIQRFGVTARAMQNGLVTLKCFNPRDYATDKHGTVDDRPYGGGPGMVMKIDTLERALEDAKGWLSGLASDLVDGASTDMQVVYLSPQGTLLTQAGVANFGAVNRLVLIAGRYEGIDERFIQAHVDVECSIGDYVLSGGELPAMVLIDALARLQPGALGDGESAEQDSFMKGLLDCPHYTRPESYKGRNVPPVLLSGDHGKISQWRHMQSLGRTAERRPGLLEKLTLSEEQIALLAQYQASGATNNECN